MSCYETLVQTLSEERRFGEKKTDLSVPLALAEKLGHPEKKFPSVHIAGTNGKGTVALKMAAVLEENGYRVGLFTSPHLITFRERIQINRSMISEKEVVKRLEKIMSLAPNGKFFELTTLLAFDYFADEEVDIAIVEAGLGGRLDATNILSPLLSIITTVQEDHIPILGETLDDIAREKGGIIKENTPVIVGKSALREPIETIAKKKNAPLIVCPDRPLIIAKKGLKHLPFLIETTDALALRPPCRYEKRGEVILDVAHNPSALKHLFSKIENEYPGRKRHVLFSLSKGKDLEGCLNAVRASADHLGFLPKCHPRLLSLQSIYEGEVESIEEAFALAKQEGALLIVTGSFYMMETVIRFLESRKPPLLASSRFQH
ncbi:MAG: bifunctional folylpolyglutamate synthase/dihydrofolate synthase [Chlamydiia bacterium]|nr:bifunctional folylpolyglutamate synthase/dihydrofolate synthase [Chlamydiia bacterium]